MNFKIKLPFSERSLDISLSSPNWRDINDAGGKSKAGIIVDEEKALSLSVIYACVRVITETMACMPLHLYKMQGNRKEKAVDHVMYNLLHSQPNPYMTSFTFREVQTGHLMLWGNRYAEIEYDENWFPKALWPLRPDRTWPERDRTTGEIIYKTILPNGNLIALEKYRVLHIPGYGFDGLVGRSPIRMQMESIGWSAALHEYSSRFFSNGARVAGVLEHPNLLSQEALNHLRDSFDFKYAGLSNAHRTMILEEGMKYQQIGVPPEEAQFIESKKLSATEQARIYRVPPHLIGELDRATYSNIEQQFMEFYTMTILPYAVRDEMGYDTQLLTPKERKKYYSKHAMDGLLRGDIKSRYEAYKIGKQSGFLCNNDIREKEDLNPVEGGDVHMEPVNMIPADMLRKFWETRTPKAPKGGE